MSFVSAIQPLCRYCGCEIGKHTTTVWFGSSNGHTNTDWSSHRPEMPMSKAEVQAMLNQTVVSIGWDKRTVLKNGDYVEERTFIGKATIWDGLSYKDAYFCKDEHAKLFGYAAVRGGQVMAEYQDALARQGNKS